MTIHPRHLVLALAAIAFSPVLCAQEAGGDEPLTITISTETGNLWRGGEISSQSWNSKWERTSESLPSITLEDESGANNLSYDSSTKGITIAEGSTTPKSRSFYLSVESGYHITGMSFSYTTNVSDLTLAIGDETTIELSSEGGEETVTGLDASQVVMHLSSISSENKAVTLNNWTVTVVPYEEETDLSTLKVAPTEGTFSHYNGSSYAYLWTSTYTPTLTLANANGSTTNNMIGDSSRDGISMYEGSSNNFTYTLSVESGYHITGMTFKAVSVNGVTDMTVTVGNHSFNPSATEQTIEISDIDAKSVDIDLYSSSGSNEGVTFYDWTVSVEAYDASTDPGIVYSTEGAEHWYYVISSSTKSYCSGKLCYFDE